MEGFIAIPSITVICYLAAEIYKEYSKSAQYNKHIPAVCGVVGALLGAVCYYFLPGFIPAENVITAIATGIVSGWASTGVHQVWKQNKSTDDTAA